MYSNPTVSWLVHIGPLENTATLPPSASTSFRVEHTEPKLWVVNHMPSNLCIPRASKIFGKEVDPIWSESAGDHVDDHNEGDCQGQVHIARPTIVEGAKKKLHQAER